MTDQDPRPIEDFTSAPVWDEDEGNEGADTSEDEDLGEEPQPEPETEGGK